MKTKPQIAVLASGEGTNFSAMAMASERGDLRADIAGVITDNPEAGVIRRALDHNVPVYLASPDCLDRSVLQGLSTYAPDLVVLSGFNRILGGSVIEAYRERIVNTHSAQLPEFGGPDMYGRKLREAVLASGVSRSEITVHLVDEEVDHGRVLGVSESFPVWPGDTIESLHKRAILVENRFYWQVLDAYLEELDLV